jgi:hypothetical protein
MKLYLYDSTNFGILYVYDRPNNSVDKDKWFFNILRSCILDTNFSRMLDRDPLYKNFNNQTVVNNLYVNTLSNNVRIGAEHEANLIFIEKRKRAQLIAPVVEKLVDVLYNQIIFNWANEIGINMQETLALEIMNSSPEDGRYASGILEYATALKITPEQAYTEIKLESETLNSLKMRVYTVSKKYQVLIRQIQTKEQATAMINQINQKLVADTQI